MRMKTNLLDVNCQRHAKAPLFFQCAKDTLNMAATSVLVFSFMNNEVGRIPMCVLRQLHRGKYSLNNYLRRPSVNGISSGFCSDRCRM